MISVNQNKNIYYYVMESFNLFIRNNTKYTFKFVDFENTSIGSNWSVYKKIIEPSEIMQILATTTPRNTLIGVVKININENNYSFVVINKQQRQAGASTFSLTINDIVKSKIIDGTRNPVYPNILQWKEVSCEIS
jgi:hypothetical protein